MMRREGKERGEIQKIGETKGRIEERNKKPPDKLGKNKKEVTVRKNLA